MSSEFNCDNEKPTVVYRPFCPDDYEAVAALYQAQWCDEASEAAGRIASQADLCGYLAQVNWGLIAEKPQPDGSGTQLLGVALLSLKTQPCPEAQAWTKRQEELLAQVAADPSLLAEVKDDLDMLEEESQLSSEYAASGQIGSAAELKLLIVSPAAQGLGVGGRLFSAAREAARDANGLFLITDDGCDVGFYVHKGLTRMVSRPSQVAQASFPQETGEFNIYVYAEDFSQ